VARPGQIPRIGIAARQTEIAEIEARLEKGAAD